VLATAALARPAAALADGAQLLGVPAAALPPPPAVAAGAAWPPWQASRIAGTSSSTRLNGALVVDLSSMWAGPLCARLLGLAGARVVKVESPDRPDGARAGNREFFDWLHAGHHSVVLDFRSASGREALTALLAAADVVIEASRPRALEQLGLAPSQVPHRDGQVWLSITGYGRGRPDLVAFGDDAAIAGGLVGWALNPGGDGDGPVFCADAVADPLTGACGALAVARSLAEGGGQLIDLPMRAVAAGFADADRTVHDGSHVAWREEAEAIVRCDMLGRDQIVLPPARPASAGRAHEFGADTAAVLDRLRSG
jgi:crotonobetainyl-CoA:carnitine CoA-transferase CaiB-like acyl-CoA transferase